MKNLHSPKHLTKWLESNPCSSFLSLGENVKGLLPAFRSTLGGISHENNPGSVCAEANSLSKRINWGWGWELGCEQQPTLYYMVHQGLDPAKNPKKESNIRFEMYLILHEC